MVTIRSRGCDRDRRDHHGRRTVHRRCRRALGRPARPAVARVPADPTHVARRAPRARCDRSTSGRSRSARLLPRRAATLGRRLLHRPARRRRHRARRRARRPTCAPRRSRLGRPGGVVDGRSPPVADQCSHRAVTAAPGRVREIVRAGPGAGDEVAAPPRDGRRHDRPLARGRLAAAARRPLRGRCAGCRRRRVPRGARRSRQRSTRR